MVLGGSVITEAVCDLRHTRVIPAWTWGAALCEWDSGAVLLLCSSVWNCCVTSLNLRTGLVASPFPPRDPSRYQGAERAAH